MTSKRQFPRYAHEAALTLRFGAARVTGRTANLSRGGICAMVDGPIVVGTQAQLELALVFGDNSLSESLNLVVRVAWCTAMEERHQLGLSFGVLQPEQLKFLEVFLKFLDEGASQRRAAVGGRGRGPFGA